MPENPPATPASPGDSGAEESLVRLATEISRYSTRAELFEHLPAHLRPLFPFDGVGIVLHDPVTNEVGLALSFGTPPELVPSVGDSRPVHFGPAGWVFQSQQARFDTLTPETTHPTLAHLYRAGFRSAVCALTARACKQRANPSPAG